MDAQAHLGQYQRAEERLALHELIRVGVGRQEDLRLLYNVSARFQETLECFCFWIFVILVFGLQHAN